jgi:hypothetical protein
LKGLSQKELENFFVESFSKYILQDILEEKIYPCIDQLSKGYEIEME